MLTGLPSRVQARDTNTTQPSGLVVNSRYMVQALLLSGRLTGLYTHIYIHKGGRVCFVYVHVSK